jgi:hypothetical protein
MAIIRDNRGALLASNLSQYLASAAGTAGTPVDTTELVNILNQFLGEGDQVGANSNSVSNGIYKQFGSIDKVTNRTEVVTSGIWSGDSGSLGTFFTSSAQQATISGKYYLDTYNLTPSSSASEVQFSIAYGHISGGGAPTLDQTDSSTLPTKAVYSQFRNILLDSGDSYFSVYNGATAGGHDLDDIFVININRARYKEQLDPGNIQLNLRGSNGKYISLIDDSGQINAVGASGRVFNMVSGALNIGTANEGTINSTTASNGQGFGLFYPDAGVIVLNPNAISASTAGGNRLTATYSASTMDVYEANNVALFNLISASGDFQARRTENVSTSHYFVRANNREFNFSNNPTFVTGSTGKFVQPTFETDPKVYITTVGLYDGGNELIAVAKISKPIQKSFDTEVAIKVKLDF